MMENIKKHLLKIELFMHQDGTAFEFDYSQHFFLFLKNNKQQREYVISEMVENLNRYIDEVKDE